MYLYMLIEIFFIIILCIFYFFIYVDLKINKNNDIYLFEEELTRSSINKETFLKLPFYFNGKHINKKIDKSILTIKDKKQQYEVYTKPYENIDLLLPQIRSNMWCEVYYIYKNKGLPLMKQETSINYCIVKNGTCKVYFIHPKFKEHFNTWENNKQILSKDKSKIDFIKKNSYITNIIFHKNTVLYIPNEWIIYVENIGENTCVLEKINYSTLFNQLIRRVKKVFNK